MSLGTFLGPSVSTSAGEGIAQALELLGGGNMINALFVPNSRLQPGKAITWSTGQGAALIAKLTSCRVYHPRLCAEIRGTRVGLAGLELLYNA